MILIIGREMNQMILINYCIDISPVYHRYINQFVCLFFFFFHKPAFFVSDI